MQNIYKTPESNHSRYFTHADVKKNKTQNFHNKAKVAFKPEAKRKPKHHTNEKYG